MTDDRWQMTDDRWQITDDRWQMTDDRWQMTDDRRLPTYYKWWHNTLTALNVSQPQYPSCPSLSPCAASPCPLWTTWTGSSPSQLTDLPALVYNICYETARRVEQSTTTTIDIRNCALSRAWHCDSRKIAFSQNRNSHFDGVFSTTRKKSHS